MAATTHRTEQTVGRHAFAHESGIHQDGVLKERTTYEIMDATTVGLEANSLVLGKHSGRHPPTDARGPLGHEPQRRALTEPPARAPPPRRLAHPPGRHALKDALGQLGYEVDGAQLNHAFKRFKEVAD